MSVITSTPSIIFKLKFVGRYARLRLPRTALRHTEAQLNKITGSPAWLPPVLLGDKGLVIAGFALAQILNKSVLGTYVTVIKYSSMTEALVREYVERIEGIARRHKWDNDMRAVELQYLELHG